HQADRDRPGEPVSKRRAAVACEVIDKSREDERMRPVEVSWGPDRDRRPATGGCGMSANEHSTATGQHVPHVRSVDLGVPVPSPAGDQQDWEIAATVYL